MSNAIEKTCRQTPVAVGDTVRLDLKRLFNSKGFTLTYGRIHTYTTHKADGSGIYQSFTLDDVGGSLALMDGEEAKVTDIDDDSVTLLSLEDEDMRKFTLSREEFDIAAFGSRAEGCFRFPHPKQPAQYAKLFKALWSRQAYLSKDRPSEAEVKFLGCVRWDWRAVVDAIDEDSRLHDYQLDQLIKARLKIHIKDISDEVKSRRKALMEDAAKADKEELKAFMLFVPDSDIHYDVDGLNTKVFFSNATDSYTVEMYKKYLGDLMDEFGSEIGFPIQDKKPSNTEEGAR